MKLKDFIACMLIVLLIFAMSLFYNDSKGCDAYKYFKDEYDNGTLGMYYTGDDYYCVWVGNLTKDKIEEIDEHEACHHLVYLNDKHFCD